MPTNRVPSKRVVAVAELDPHRVRARPVPGISLTQPLPLHISYVRFLRRSWRLQVAASPGAPPPTQPGPTLKRRAVVGEARRRSPFSPPGVTGESATFTSFCSPGLATKWSTDWLTSPRTSSTLTVPAWAAAGGDARARPRRRRCARIRLLSFMAGCNRRRMLHRLAGELSPGRPCACGRARAALPCGRTLRVQHQLQRVGVGFGRGEPVGPRCTRSSPPGSARSPGSARVEPLSIVRCQGSASVKFHW